MNAIRTATLAAALSAALVAPALGMTAANSAAVKSGAEVKMAAFVMDDLLAPGRFANFDHVDVDAAATAAQNYFDYDTIISLGALALAGGAMTALGALMARRKSEYDATQLEEADWRSAVMNNLREELSEFADSFRRAA